MLENGGGGGHGHVHKTMRCMLGFQGYVLGREMFLKTGYCSIKKGVSFF